MDQKVTKAARGQEIKEVTALDRSSVGSKAQAALNAAQGEFKGGITNIGHSLQGASAVVDGNGGVKGRPTNKL